MKKILVILALLSALCLSAETREMEFYNEVSEESNPTVCDIPVVRSINGGTVIKVDFASSCPEQIKAPFMHACKILEEYLPPCLPLKVRVECEMLTGSARKAISKVNVNCLDSFGDNWLYSFVPRTTMKGVMMGEMSYNNSHSYLPYLPSLEFIKDFPDFTIVYNENLLDEIAFSVENVEDDKYDFVSVVLRDLLRGLGLGATYTYNPLVGNIFFPYDKMTPFEIFLKSKLVYEEDGDVQLNLATQGQLELINGLSLYAPDPWVNGKSLNFFIPGLGSQVGDILAYNFGKGTVTRALNDGYWWFICYELLGWKFDFTTSSSNVSYTSQGSTSLLMPYNGELDLEPGDGYSSIGAEEYGVAREDDGMESSKPNAAIASGNSSEAISYAEMFHPFLTPSYMDKAKGTGVSVAVLKKDGLWDLVFFTPAPEMMADRGYRMEDWEFHYDNEEYARSRDGYLRGRITIQQYGMRTSKSWFFVMDYLPQKVDLGYQLLPTVQTASTSIAEPNAATVPVRVYFNNTEGVTRIVLESLRQGARVPSKINVTDLSKGYYDVNIDRATTFTAVAYNENGATRGDALTVTPLAGQSLSALSFVREGSTIKVKNSVDDNARYAYTVMGCTAVASPVLKGTTATDVDVVSLPGGLYILSVEDLKTGEHASYKFSK